MNICTHSPTCRAGNTHTANSRAFSASEIQLEKGVYKRININHILEILYFNLVQNCNICYLTGSKYYIHQ